MKKTYKVIIKIFVFLLVLCTALLWKTYFFSEASKNVEYGKEGKIFTLLEGDFKNDLDLQGATTNASIALLGDPPKTQKYSLKEGVFAVMIDNHSLARPHHRGIEKAKIVFEAPAEGGIPRWMAIFSINDDVAEIGPVRSTRDYFLDILRPFSAVIVHAGGSPKALEELSETKDFLDLDHEYGDEQFWRDEDVSRPHNLFTSSSEIFNYAKEEEWSKAINENVLEYGNLFISENSVDEFSVEFGLSSYLVLWKWDKEKNCFLRQQNYEELEICSKNVIVIVSEQWLLGDDDKYRIGISTTGEGTSYIFRNGKYLKCIL